MKVLYRFLQMSLIMLLFAALGCSGSSNSGPAVKKGVFVDAPVVGLGYDSGSQSGVTDENGEFNYVEGETVSFFVGGVELGSSQGGDVVTPLDLVDEDDAYIGSTPVTNIVRFLTSISTPDANGNLVIPEDAAELLENTEIDFKTVDEDSLAAAVQKVDSNKTLKKVDEAQAHLSKSLEDLAEGDDAPKLSADMFNDKSFVYLISETKEKGVLTFKSDGKLIDASDDDIDSWSIKDGKLIIEPAAEDEATTTATLISKIGNTIRLLVAVEGETDRNILVLTDNKNLKFTEAMIKGETFNYSEITTNTLGETVEEPESGSVTFNADYTVCGIDENGKEDCGETWSISDKGQLCTVDEEADKDCYYLFSQKDKTIVAFIKEGENTRTLTLTEFDPSKEVTLSSGDFFRFSSEPWGGSSIMYDDIEGELLLPHSMALLVQQNYADITQAPYGVYRDSNGDNPPVFPAKAGDVYVFQSPGFSEEGHTMPDYYRLEIISATKRPSVESTDLGAVKFKYAKIQAPDFVDVFGEWVFDDNAHLSVMGLEMMDYHPPRETGEEYGMFFFDRLTVTSKNTVEGTLNIDGRVKLTFTPKGEKLDVKIEKLAGSAPLVNTTITNGVKQDY